MRLLALAAGALALGPAAATAAAPGLAPQSCMSTCKGTTADSSRTDFDLAALMGIDFETEDADGNTYFLSVCGESQQTCPSADVQSGTAVQVTANLPNNGCNVLGQYQNNNCEWIANPGGQEGIQLSVDQGSSSDCDNGYAREVTINFMCPEAGNQGPLIPNTWEALSLGEGSCQYTYTLETCAACQSGCYVPPPPSPPPSPSTSMGWGDVFLLVLGVGVGLYVLAGVAFNFFSRGARDAGSLLTLNPEFWGALCGNARAGLVFTFTGGARTGDENTDQYNGVGTAHSSDVSYQGDI